MLEFVHSRKHQPGAFPETERSRRWTDRSPVGFEEPDVQCLLQRR